MPDTEPHAARIPSPDHANTSFASELSRPAQKREVHLAERNATERVAYVALSLQESADRDERSGALAANQKVIPELEVFPSVNGYNKTQTVEKLRESGLHYEELSLKKYGQLANFLTKFAILKRQVLLFQSLLVISFLHDVFYTQ